MGKQYSQETIKEMFAIFCAGDLSGMSIRDYKTIDDFAKFFDVSPSTLYLWKLKKDFKEQVKKVIRDNSFWRVVEIQKRVYKDACLGNLQAAKLCFILEGVLQSESESPNITLVNVSQAVINDKFNKAARAALEVETDEDRTLEDGLKVKGVLNAKN